VLAYDGELQLVGLDDSDGNFLLGGSLLPPRPVDGSRMVAERASDGTTTFFWEWPEVDVQHGPAAGFRVLTTTERGGVLSQVDLVGQPVYLDPAGDPSPGQVFYYRFVATNAAGDAAE